MIRFCDKELLCVRNDELDRSALFSYFLNGCRDQILCVVDTNGMYEGKITYTSLLNSVNETGCIETDKVVLDEYVWENARDFFINYKKFGDEIVVLPVVDKGGNLLCFAYEDADANREIRQLHELAECQNALSFQDIFPQYERVTIWECNELAYYFAIYLKEHGVPVSVKGDYWEKFGSICEYTAGTGEGLNYKNLNIYAEGTWEKNDNLREYLLRSVSVEFECVNEIYEGNIKKGIVRNALYGDKQLLQNLNKSEIVVLKDIGEDSIRACDWFFKNGIEKICFLVYEDQNKRLIAGKELLCFEEICKKYTNISLIDCNSKFSAWGPGDLDYYDYMGYRRNVNYFCLKDYIDLSYGDMKYLLREKDIVLTGDIFLCKKFYSYYEHKQICNSLVYYDILDEKKGEFYNGQMPLGEESCIKRSAFFLVIAPEYNYNTREMWSHNKDRVNSKIYVDKLEQKGYFNYIVMKNIIPYNQYNDTNKYSCCKLIPKAIIIGAVLGACGNLVLRDVLGKYNKILTINYGFLNGNLMLFCVKLAGERSSDILKIFWKLIREAVGEKWIKSEFCDVEAFNNKLTEMLRLTYRPTAQELFVMFHVAYNSMYGKDISDIKDYVIYWERHGVRRNIGTEIMKWLDAENITGLVVVNCRNNTVRTGGLLKFLKSVNYFERTDTLLFRLVLESPEEWDTEKCVWENIEVKFEELKYQPKKVMNMIGNKIGVDLSEALKDSLYDGQVDYEYMEHIVKPIHNAYEEFLSQFDKMRIALLTAEWQKKRNYPYIEIENITRKNMQEMFLPEFRFEKMLVFNNAEEHLKYRQNRQNWLRNQFVSLRINQFYKERDNEV